MKYITVPHQFYEGEGGSLFHFNEDTLALTEVDPTHREVLVDFTEARTKNDVLAKRGGGADVAEVIDELIELELVATQMPPPPVAVFNLRPNVRAFRIVLTERCNLRCAECFVVKNADKLRVMAPKTLERVIRGTIPYGAKHRVTYHFFGGEPLLRFDYIKRAVEIAEEAVAASQMVRPLYTMTTNLTLLTDEMISFFQEHDVKVGVSVDGPEEINDKLRVYVDGRGTFKKVHANYMRLVEAGIDVHVLITPNPDFLDKLPFISKSVLDAFPMKTVTVNTPLHFDTVQWTVPGAEYARLLVQLTGMARAYGVSVDSAASPPLAALAGNVKREGPCALVCDTVMASIGPDGSMSFCSQKWHPYLTTPFGGGDTTLETPIHREDECLTCSARNICGGPCPAYQRIAGATLDTNKCNFMRALVGEATRNLHLFEVE